jgi:hypothetical protein
MKKTLAVLILAASAAPAGAVFMGGVDQTFGKDDYKGTGVYAGVNLGPLSITPEYRRWQDKNSGGGFNTGLLRLGFDTRWVGAGVTAGATARHQQYSNLFAGADVSATLSPLGDDQVRRIGGPGRGAAPVGEGLARVDFGGGVQFTHHKQDANDTVSGATLGQTDAHAFIGVSFLKILLSGRFCRSFYGKDIKTLAAPLPRYEPVAGLLFSNGSYPERSLHLLAELPMLPLVTPYASFTSTRYAEILSTRPGDTQAYTAGLRVGLDMLTVSAAFQRVAVTGASDANYMNVGAGLRF